MRYRVLCGFAAVLLAPPAPGSGPGSVTFRDPFLEAAVRDALAQPGEPLNKSSLLTLTELSARGRGIVHLDGIEELVHLRVLDLAMNLIYDLTPLSALTELERLDLEDNRVSDISPLRPLVRLQSLMLAANHVADITPLKDLSGLASADLMGNPLASASAAPVVWLLTRRGVRVASSAILPVSAAESGPLRWEAWGPSLRPRALRVISVAVAPDDPQRVYAGTLDNGMWVTGDGGSTWEPSALSGYVAAISTDARDPGLVYASAAPVGPGVWRSRDGGESWEAAPAPPLVGLVAADPSVSGRVYCAYLFYPNWVCCQQPTELGVALYMSADRGDTWRLAGEWVQSYTGDTAAPFAFSDPADPRHVWVGGGGRGAASGLTAVFRSRDGGETWETVELSVTLSALAPDPAVPGALYGVCAGGLYHSLDEGRTWAQVGAVPRRQVDRLHVAAGSPVDLWAWVSAGTGVWRSRDTGRTWSGGSIPGMVAGAGPVRARTDPARGYAGTRAGLARTADGGFSWESVPLTLSDPGVRRVTVDAEGAVYAVVTPGNGLWVRRTPWDSWQSLPSTAADGAQLSLSLLWADVRHPGLLFGHDREAGWLRSADAGFCWEPMRLSGVDTVASAARARLAASPEGPGVYYALDPVDRTLYRSEDVGLSWDTVAADVGLFAVHPRIPGFLVAATPGGDLVRASKDGARTWSALRGCPDGQRLLDLAIRRQEPGAVVAACTGGLYALSLVGGEPRRDLPA
ncbi:MAG: leucine-rich repeat domain-containing protein, partial [Candidatus Latescibacterota bacterium]